MDIKSRHFVRVYACSGGGGTLYVQSLNTELILCA